jgi:hypothetical protein
VGRESASPLPAFLTDLRSACGWVSRSIGRGGRARARAARRPIGALTGRRVTSGPTRRHPRRARRTPSGACTPTKSLPLLAPRRSPTLDPAPRAAAGVRHPHDNDALWFNLEEHAVGEPSHRCLAPRCDPNRETVGRPCNFGQHPIRRSEELQIQSDAAIPEPNRRLLDLRVCVSIDEERAIHRSPSLRRMRARTSDQGFASSEPRARRRDSSSSHAFSHSGSAGPSKLSINSDANASRSSDGSSSARVVMSRAALLMEGLYHGRASARSPITPATRP